MSAQLIDGKAVSEQRLQSVTEQVAARHVQGSGHLVWP